jgi:iron complex transport system substrate-binding protein
MCAPRPNLLVLALALVLSLLAVRSAYAETTVVDGTGRTVTIGDTSRILSVGGDVTEILYALGAGPRIVAVDTTSQFPPEVLKEKKNVGYLRALSSEGVISVGASVIVASDGAGPPEVVKTLKAASTPYVTVSDDHSQDGLASKIRLIAKAVGAETEGEKLLQQIAAGFRELSAARAKITRRNRVLFVLAIQNGRLLVGGRDTSADAVIKLAGGENVAEGIKGFRPLPDEAIVEMAPDVILAMRRSSDNDNHDLSQLFSLKGVQATPAGKAKRIIMQDGLYMLGFGPRTPDAARALMAELYPTVVERPSQQ